MGAIHGKGFTEELYKRVPKDTYLRDTKPYSDDATEREYAFYHKGTDEKIVTFRARPLPGCCGVLVVYYLRPVQVKDSIKVFKKTLKLIFEVAGRAQFGNVLMTLTGPMIQEVYPGWFSVAHEFTNWKTGNHVAALLFDTGDFRPKPKTQVSFEGE